jgi:hypothetical protein
MIEGFRSIFMRTRAASGCEVIRTALTADVHVEYTIDDCRNSIRATAASRAVIAAAAAASSDSMARKKQPAWGFAQTIQLLRP